MQEASCRIVELQPTPAPVQLVLPWTDQPIFDPIHGLHFLSVKCCKTLLAYQFVLRAVPESAERSWAPFRLSPLQAGGNARVSSRQMRQCQPVVAPSGTFENYPRAMRFLWILYASNDIPIRKSEHTGQLGSAMLVPQAADEHDAVSVLL